MLGEAGWKLGKAESSRVLVRWDSLWVEEEGGCRIGAREEGYVLQMGRRQAAESIYGRMRKLMLELWLELRCGVERV
jgi:hypothetical protein